MNTLEKRVYQSVCRDGLLEMTVGTYMVLLGSIFIFQPKLVVFSVFFMFLLKPLVQKVKNTCIYPRTGYVKLKKEDEAVGKGIAITAVVFVLILAGSLIALILSLGTVPGRNIWFRWFLPILSSIMFAFGPLWVATTYGLKRAYVFAAFVPLCGIAVAVTGVTTGYTSIGIVCLASGIPALVSGMIMFNSFLRRYPLEDVSNVIE